MQFTLHFKREEFDCKDGTKVPEELFPNLQELCNNLETLRAYLTDELVKKGIHDEARLHINSGYRTEGYQLKVNPKVKDSQHMHAKAADITCKYFTPKQIARAIGYLIEKKLMKEGGIGLYPGFVHYDVRGTHARW